MGVWRHFSFLFLPCSIRQPCSSMRGSSHPAWTPNWRPWRIWLMRPVTSHLRRNSSTWTESPCSRRWWRVGLSKWLVVFLAAVTAGSETVSVLKWQTWIWSQSLLWLLTRSDTVFNSPTLHGLLGVARCILITLGRVILFNGPTFIMWPRPIITAFLLTSHKREKYHPAIY